MEIKELLYPYWLMALKLTTIMLTSIKFNDRNERLRKNE